MAVMGLMRAAVPIVARATMAGPNHQQNMAAAVLTRTEWSGRNDPDVTMTRQRATMAETTGDRGSLVSETGDEGRKRKTPIVTVATLETAGERKGRWATAETTVTAATKVGAVTEARGPAIIATGTDRHVIVIDVDADRQAVVRMSRGPTTTAATSESGTTAGAPVVTTQRRK